MKHMTQQHCQSADAANKSTGIVEDHHNGITNQGHLLIIKNYDLKKKITHWIILFATKTYDLLGGSSSAMKIRLQSS